MITRISINPALLSWAIERSGNDKNSLRERFPKLDAWLCGEALPTLKQVERFAKATRTPIGLLFLDNPPEEKIPIPDYRTRANNQIGVPSVNLLDTIYHCQRRQDWYKEYATINQLSKLDFIGSVTLSTPIEQVAQSIRAKLDFNLDARATMPTWEDALRSFIEQVDSLGVLIMRSGMVNGNTHRPLNREEFNGFALADEVAPLIFINGNDYKAAQMFTLAHELAHLWLGESALSNANANTVERGEQAIERWCDAVSAEVLVPLAVFKTKLRNDEAIEDALQRLAREFKVSSLVILRRMRDAGVLSYASHSEHYQMEVERIANLPSGKGGNFYPTKFLALSKTFIQAVAVDAMEGKTLYGNAMDLLGIKKPATFNQLAQQAGIAI